MWGGHGIPRAAQASRAVHGFASRTGNATRQLTRRVLADFHGVGGSRTGRTGSSEASAVLARQELL